LWNCGVADRGIISNTVDENVAKRVDVRLAFSTALRSS